VFKNWFDSCKSGSVGTAIAGTLSRARFSWVAGDLWVKDRASARAFSGDPVIKDVKT